MRVLLRIAFDGTRYAGWQVQPDRETVQSRICAVLAKIYDVQSVDVTGSSRTDSGVHALGFAAHFDMPDGRFPIVDIPYRLNSLLPDDIRIVSASPVPADFHARYSAKGKIYRYIIANPHPTRAGRALILDKLPDLDILLSVGRLFIGSHDFSGFAVKASLPDNRECTISRLEWQRTLDSSIVMEIEGDRFLHHMVRFIVGAHLEVAEGRLREDEIVESLETGQRLRIKNPTGEGLYLVHVFY